MKFGLKKSSLQACFDAISMGRTQINAEDLISAFEKQRLPVDRKLSLYLIKTVFQSEFMREK